MNKVTKFNGHIMINDFDELFKKNNNLEFFAGKTILIAGATSFLLTYFIKFVLYCNDINVFKKNVKILAM